MGYWLVDYHIMLRDSICTNLSLLLPIFVQLNIITRGEHPYNKELQRKNVTLDMYVAFIPIQIPNTVKIGHASDIA